MSEPFTRPVARPVSRLARPSWLDTRVLLGLLLILIAVVAGARVFASADRYTRLYVAAHALVPGEHLVASDLTTGEVRLDGQGADYVSAGGAPPVGYVVERYVGAGEFLPVGAIATASEAAPDRLVTVPVQPGHLPPDVGPGDLVDLYVTAKSADGSSAGRPLLAAHDLAVQERDGGSSELSGSTVLSLVLAVPVAEVPVVVHAAEAGAIDVVLVPPAQAATATPASGLARPPGAPVTEESPRVSLSAPASPSPPTSHSPPTPHSRTVGRAKPHRSGAAKHRQRQ